MNLGASSSLFNSKSARTESINRLPMAADARHVGGAGVGWVALHQVGGVGVVLGLQAQALLLQVPCAVFAGAAWQGLAR